MNISVSGLAQYVTAVRINIRKVIDEKVVTNHDEQSSKHGVCHDLPILCVSLVSRGRRPFSLHGEPWYMTSGTRGVPKIYLASSDRFSYTLTPAATYVRFFPNNQPSRSRISSRSWSDKNRRNTSRGARFSERGGGCEKGLGDVHSGRQSLHYRVS